MPQNSAVALACKVEISMVGDVDRRSFICRGIVVDRQLIVVGKLVSDFDIQIPRFVAASTSTLSYPTPYREMILHFLSSPPSKGYVFAISVYNTGISLECIIKRSK